MWLIYQHRSHMGGTGLKEQINVFFDLHHSSQWLIHEAYCFKAGSPLPNFSKPPGISHSTAVWSQVLSYEVIQFQSATWHLILNRKILHDRWRTHAFYRVASLMHLRHDISLWPCVKATEPLSKREFKDQENPTVLDNRLQKLGRTSFMGLVWWCSLDEWNCRTQRGLNARQWCSRITSPNANQLHCESYRQQGWYRTGIMLAELEDLRNNNMAISALRIERPQM